jgi:hypothetical protein
MQLLKHSLSSLAVALAGVAVLHATSPMQDEGECVWTLGTSGDCWILDVWEECEAHVEAECHSPNWQVSRATCFASGSIECRATWQN